MSRSTQQILKDYFFTILIAIGIAFFIRHFLIEAYQVPSVSSPRASHFSMTPTLLAGDTIFISKWPHWFQSKFESQLNHKTPPQRGDIVVFAEPLHFVGRVLGLPGDLVSLKQGAVILNGKSLLNRDRVSETVDSHLNYSLRLDSPLIQDFGPILVPIDSIFVIGDSRTSPDRKKGKGWEIIPFSAIVGKVLWIWLSIDPEGQSGWVPHFRFDRMFKRVQ